MEEKPIQVKTIVVRTGRIVCDIEIPSSATSRFRIPHFA